MHSRRIRLALVTGAWLPQVRTAPDRTASTCVCSTRAGADLGLPRPVVPFVGPVSPGRRPICDPFIAMLVPARGAAETALPPVNRHKLV